MMTVFLEVVVVVINDFLLFHQLLLSLIVVLVLEYVFVVAAVAFATTALVAPSQGMTCPTIAAAAFAHVAVVVLHSTIVVGSDCIYFFRLEYVVGLASNFQGVAASTSLKRLLSEVVMVVIADDYHSIPSKSVVVIVLVVFVGFATSTLLLPLEFPRVGVDDRQLTKINDNGVVNSCGCSCFRDCCCCRNRFRC